MTILHQQVRRARNRLWLGIWLELTCRVVAWTAGAFAAAVLVTRLGGWTLPWGIVGSGLTALAVAVSLAWSVRRRPSAAVAAAALDQAVGLRERVSSSLYCEQSDDPYARAVCADAQARAAAVTVSRHLRLGMPASAPRAGAALVLAAAMFLVPSGLLARAEAKEEARKEVELARTQAEVKKRLDDVKKMAETNPALADLKTDFEKLAPLAPDKMDKPSDVRQEALKKIDKLADAVREKQKSDKFDRVSETKRMLRAIKEPPGEKSPVQKLARDLAAGDVKSAKETIREMQEQLATLKKDSDKPLVEQMQKQLEHLAKQMDKLAQQDQLKKELEQAGIKKEDVERMLEKLTKEDLEQIRKQLEKSGMSQKQIDKLCQQCQKQQGAAQAVQQMSQAMSSAAQSAGDGQMGDAMNDLESAEEQLSELESLEQEMNQLESAMSSLQQAKSECSGQGQGQGESPGRGGLGQLGRGQGGLAPSQQTDVDFKIERGKVETTKGRIVGQFLVDGEQVKGEADETFVELIQAGERDATDTVNRDRIPRQYHKALKEYFSRLPAQFGITPLDPSGEAAHEAAAGDSEEAAPTDAAAPPSGDQSD